MPCNFEAPHTAEITILYRLSILLERDRPVETGLRGYQVMHIFREAQNKHERYICIFVLPWWFLDVSQIREVSLAEVLEREDALSSMSQAL